MKDYFSLAEVANALSVSKETLRRWDKSGKLTPVRHPMNGYRVYPSDSLKQFNSIGAIFEDAADTLQIPALQPYSVIELFAGAGGLALGLEKAGLKCTMLNELNKDACTTLRKNRPNWNVKEGDIAEIDFKPYHNKVDVVTGGFPCQSFSYAGKRLGFEVARGTLFYQFARAVTELVCRFFGFRWLWGG